jgi:hypothetical protein
MCAVLQCHIGQEPFVTFDQSGGDKGCGKLHGPAYNMVTTKETTNAKQDFKCGCEPDGRNARHW